MALTHRLRKAVFVRAVVPPHRSDPDRRKAVGGHLQRGRRNIDQLHKGERFRRVRREYGELLPAAASKLRKADGPLERSYNRAGVRGEQCRLRASDAVPRQPADRLKERGAELVVEIARGELAPRPLQVLANLARERRQRRSFTQRNFAYT